MATVLELVEQGVSQDSSEVNVITCPFCSEICNEDQSEFFETGFLCILLAILELML